MEETPQDEVRLVSPRDVATQLAVSVRGLKRLVDAGELAPPLRIGQRSIRWRSVDIAAYLQRMEEKALAAAFRMSNLSNSANVGGNRPDAA